MKVLLVTLSNVLPIAFEQALNPKNDYCAIVVDEPLIAKKNLSKFGLSEDLIYPIYDLKECIQNFDFDCLLCISDRATVNVFPEHFRYCGLPVNKLVHFYLTDDGNNCFIISRAMRYFKKYAKNFDMIATGMSYASLALDATQFKHRLFNFSKASQDLYYDYQIAKFALSRQTGGGGD